MFRFQTVTVLDVAADADVPVVTLDFSGVPAVEDNRNFGLRISPSPKVLVTPD